jgi:hypothetical protein
MPVPLPMGKALHEIVLSVNEESLYCQYCVSNACLILNMATGIVVISLCKRSAAEVRVLKCV